ncbi:MAG: hypothetical protein HUU07_09620 [Candidatus Brocadia sinica]|nr:hypothetical protein [Candidatus Brocadia sinica]
MLCKCFDCCIYFIDYRVSFALHGQYRILPFSIITKVYAPFLAGISSPKAMNQDPTFLYHLLIVRKATRNFHSIEHVCLGQLPFFQIISVGDDRSAGFCQSNFVAVDHLRCPKEHLPCLNASGLGKRRTPPGALRCICCVSIGLY